jgi:hypothetical protein
MQLHRLTGRLQHVACTHHHHHHHQQQQQQRDSSGLDAKGTKSAQQPTCCTRQGFGKALATSSYVCTRCAARSSGSRQVWQLACTPSGAAMLQPDPPKLSVDLVGLTDSHAHGAHQQSITASVSLIPKSATDRLVAPACLACRRPLQSNFEPPLLWLPGLCGGLCGGRIHDDLYP